MEERNLVKIAIEQLGLGECNLLATEEGLRRERLVKLACALMAGGVRCRLSV